MNLLRKLYHISSPSGHETLMMNFIRSQLDKLGVTYVTDRMGNIYATKAMQRPTLASFHTPTKYTGFMKRVTT